MGTTWFDQFEDSAQSIIAKTIASDKHAWDKLKGLNLKLGFSADNYQMMINVIN